MQSSFSSSKCLLASCFICAEHRFIMCSQTFFATVFFSTHLLKFMRHMPISRRTS